MKWVYRVKWIYMQREMDLHGTVMGLDLHGRHIEQAVYTADTQSRLCLYSRHTEQVRFI